MRHVVDAKDCTGSEVYFPSDRIMDIIVGHIEEHYSLDDAALWSTRSAK